MGSDQIHSVYMGLVQNWNSRVHIGSPLLVDPFWVPDSRSDLYKIGTDEHCTLVDLVPNESTYEAYPIHVHVYGTVPFKFPTSSV